MSTTYSTRTNLEKPASGDRSWADPLNRNADKLDAVNAVGVFAVVPAEQPSASLNVKVAAGVFVDWAGAYQTYAGTSSFALTASVTNLLWLTDGGTLTKGTSWPAAGTHVVRLASVVTGVGTVTGVTDARTPFRSAG